MSSLTLMLMLLLQTAHFQSQSYVRGQCLGKMHVELSYPSRRSIWSAHWQLHCWLKSRVDSKLILWRKNSWNKAMSPRMKRIAFSGSFITCIWYYIIVFVSKPWNFTSQLLMETSHRSYSEKFHIAATRGNFTSQLLVETSHCSHYGKLCRISSMVL